MAREQIFGPQEASAASVPQQPLSQDAASFVTNLFSRWNVPPISPYAPQMATDFYHFLSSALQQQAPETSRDGMPNAATLIPAGIEGKADKTRFIELQRERLRMVMAALELEMDTIRVSGDAGGTSVAAVLDNAVGQGAFSRSHSSGNMVGDFDHVSMSDAENDVPVFVGTPKSGGWFGWGGKPVATPPTAEKQHEE